MTLGQLIKKLEKMPLTKVAKNGFGKARSYRGYYDQIAFEPKANVDAHYMLLQAKQALGATYSGYKGGRFKMTENTPVNIAHYGMCGDDDYLTESKFEAMFAE